MARLTESTECTDLITVGDELARTHDVNTLMFALSTKLNINGYKTMANLIAVSAREEAKGPYTRAAWFAIALVGRLRVEGRNELADALVSLLSGGSIEVDPVLWLDEAHARIAVARKMAAWARARGHHKQADGFDSSLSTPLRSALIDRLQADGHDELADALVAAWVAFHRQEQEWRDGEAPVPWPPVAARPVEPPPELGRAHPADVLAYALVTKLRAEGREIFAGSVMMLWAHEIAGPMVDPAPIAVELIAQLRIEGRGALADTIASLLRGASIGRDPCEIMALWLKELAGPVVDSGPLATGLVAALRKEREEGLADAVVALLGASR
jgi:hypothetical protein